MGHDELPHGVEWLRVIWVDCAGVRRCRVVPRAAAAAAARDGLGLATVCLFLPCHADSPPDDPAASPAGEVRLCPDLSTARALPWRPTHAAALADLRAERTAGGGPWECCPRAALRRALALLAAECGGAALDVGFELEFTLARPPPPGAPPGAIPEPLDASVYCQTAALDAAAPVLDAACAYIAALGERVEQYHGESAPGQFEIVTAHAGALAAADAIVLRKEAVGAAAAAAGLAASFLPKLDAHAAGSGLHCHFSLRGGATADAARPHGLSALGEAFAAGVLAHLPALLAFTAPSPNSERRRAPSAWAGAFACWGVQNREAPLRLCGDAAPAPGGGGPSLNWELKAFDAAANPYLGLAALVACGVAGVRAGLTLPSPAAGDPARMSAAARAACGAAPLPASLGEAIAAAEADAPFMAVLREALGSDVFPRAYLAVKRAEAARFAGATLEEEVAALRDRY